MTTISGQSRYSIYTGRATNWPMAILSTAIAVPLLILGIPADGNLRDLTLPLLTVAGVLLNLLTAIDVRTTAGPNGVSIRFGLLGWPRGDYPLDQIERADVIDLLPWSVAYGFWWTPRRTCCTVRSGPTLRLTLHTGRTVTVTVPNPHAAAAAIHDARSARS